MKRYMVVGLAVLLGAAVVGPKRIAKAVSAELNGSGIEAAAVVLSQPTRGVVFKTAAVNSNGTVANCFRCNRVTTAHLNPGQYQVGFDENVQATNGWSRWVQVDTLSIGSISNVSCTTADRFGLSSGVWVACFNNATGAGEDASFFLFVAR
jgi:predicted small secreted protein